MFYTRTLVVIFGAAGDLTRKMLARGIIHHLESLHANERQLFSFAAVDLIPMGDFRAQIIPELRKSSPATLDLAGAQTFFNRTHCFQTGSRVDDAAPLFEHVKEHLRHPGSRVVFYLALPYKAYGGVLEQIRHHLAPLKVGERLSVILEKPAHVESNGLRMITGSVHQTGIPQCNFRIVEHFAGKKFFQDGVFANDSDLVGLLGRLPEMNPQRVLVKITEMVGTAGRRYDGIGADSILNHHAFVQACIYRFLFGHGPFSAVAADRSLQIADVLCEIQRNIHKASGLYMCCRTDHCSPEHVPTGIALRYKVRMPNGPPIHHVSFHAKNTARKTTMATVEGTERSLDLFIDTFRGDTRGYGWRLRKNGPWREDHRMADERDEFPASDVIHEQFTPLRPDQACGYPTVARWALSGETGDLMPIRFQECSISMHALALATLDSSKLSGPDGRLWFDPGCDVVQELKTLQHLQQVNWRDIYFPPLV